MDGLVSVIIPAYNRARIIGECLKSVFAQTYKNIETIVVDDGSTDDTKEIVSRFNVRYIYKQNGGASSARNAGIKAANGEYIAFLDSDDVWLPDKLALQVEFLEINREFTMVYSGFERIDKDGISRGIGKRSYKLPAGACYFDILNKSSILTSTVVIRAGIFKEVGFFDEGLKTAEDFDFFMRVAKIYLIGLVEKTLVKKRQQNDSISNDRFQLYMDRITSLEKFYKESPGSKKAPFLNAICKVYIRFGRRLMRDGRFKDARRQFRNAMRRKTTYRSIRVYLKSYIKEAFYILGLERQGG